jgi:hypothetical protein
MATGDNLARYYIASISGKNLGRQIGLERLLADVGYFDCEHRPEKISRI